MINEIKGAVFDMDGTLVDSLMLWNVLWDKFGKQYLNKTSFRPAAEDDKAVRTMTLRDAMNHIHTVYGIGDDGNELLATANAIIGDFYENEVCLKEGVAEFLEFCKQKRIPMCIASATAPKHIEAGLRHCGIDTYFSRIFSCAEVGKGKEFPDVFLLAADYLGTKPEETCVFEDSLVAITTARKSGMKTVGIYDQYNYGQDEIKAIANVYIAKGETLQKLIY